MKKTLPIVLFAALLLSGCRLYATQPAPSPEVHTTQGLPTATPLPPTATLAPSATPIPTETPIPTPSYPVEGVGPSNFAANVNPFTGLEVDDPETLNRRPIVIKVENLPRDHRPQYGLSLADMVYEYYTEQGGTRFAAVYYGTDAEQVGPIRSGRFFDVNVVQMYRGVFIFGSAYEAVWLRFVNSDFANRLVLENSASCPALCRFEPNGRNYLMANTKEMINYLKARVIDNTRQVLDGMFFKMPAPDNGTEAKQVYVRYSGAIYNRWDYDPATQRYLRWVDAANDVDRNNEQYVQLTDQLTGKPIAADNVVTMCVPHSYYFRSNEIEVVDMALLSDGTTYVACDGKSDATGTGPAWVARDGQIYKVVYTRAKKDAPLSLMTEEGQPFPFKPGQTWFEVIGASSKVEQPAAGTWRFTFAIAP